MSIPSIAERHDLESGDLCEIYRLTGLGETKRHFAKYRSTYTGRYTGTNELVFDQANGGIEPLHIPEERVRSIRKVTPEEVARQFYVGQPVIVRKYGGDYSGRVAKVGKTRLSVEFATRARKRKTITIPAWEARLP